MFAACSDIRADVNNMIYVELILRCHPSFIPFKRGDVMRIAA